MSQSDGPGTPARPNASDLASTPPASGSQDVVLIHGPTDDQKGLKVLRAREQGLELGEVRPIQEGRPLTGEIVKLKPRPGHPRICDVETQLSQGELDRARGSQTPRLGHPGPARVATDAYRTNWDAIYRSPGDSSGSSDLN